jgi:tetratricopeptide (TPR) repeat protein
MRFRLAFVVLLLLSVQSVDASFGQGNANFDRMISGRLIYDNGEFSCDRCVVNLLMSGVRPIASTYADLSGRFSFRSVPRGTYTVHIQIEGFEEVRQEIEIGNGIGHENNVTILLVRAAVQTERATRHIIDASEILDRFPKKAVNAFKKGLDNKKKNKSAQALKNFEEAVRIAPDFYMAHNELGLAYKEAGRFTDAERSFMQAHELNQSSADPLVNLTSLYLEENKPDRAIEAGEQAIKKNSRSASAFFNLGLALYKMAMLDRAENALKKALELAPKMAAVRLMLANVYLKARKRDKLMEQLDSYLAENPKGDRRHDVEQMRERVLTTPPQATP